MARHAQITQNSKSAMSLQYLRKEIRDEVDFLHAYKHQIFLPGNLNTLSTKVSFSDTFVIDGHDRAFS